MLRRALLLMSLIVGYLTPSFVFGEEIDVTRELANVKAFYENDGPKLLIAQSLLRTFGVYSAGPDGIWGPATEKAFEDVLQSYIAIGGTGSDWGVNAPQDTSRFINWVAEAAHANATGSEFPD